MVYRSFFLFLLRRKPISGDPIAPPLRKGPTLLAGGAHVIPVLPVTEIFAPEKTLFELQMRLKIRKLLFTFTGIPTPSGSLGRLRLSPHRARKPGLFRKGVKGMLPRGCLPLFRERGGSPSQDLKYFSEPYLK